MEDKQILTAISDLVLGSSALYNTFILWNRRNGHVPSNLDLIYHLVPIVGSLGFLLISLAAFTGVIRFARLLSFQQSYIVSVHTNLSLLGSLTALPLIAAEYSKQTKYPQFLWVFIALSILAPIRCFVSNKQSNNKAIKEFTSTVSIIFINIVCITLSKYAINYNGLFGSFCFIIGGIVIGTEGKGMFGLNNVDWFHYILSVGLIAWEMGIY